MIHTNNGGEVACGRRAASGNLWYILRDVTVAASALSTITPLLQSHTGYSTPHKLAYALLGPVKIECKGITY